ncbi:hypothetical protein B0T17DRAFT_18265 [Bombardia bombarda]|uniref:Rab-GAP TBC domain-containing protein n=1 Tax=Bombardia bombarda TaxID=252184 RepID=A0AA40CEU1_9PEZI|nr:hypothetical protein B0T17DRAFT_18265 [Bombardia bombarda]
MAPQRFASVRHKTRPAARLAPFRDDSGLVAFRYEQTKQAELPIPLPPPRNPQRGTRPHSTLASGAPVVVVPPSVPPPQEQHPLFRTQSESPSQSDEWKRDSCVATSSPSATIREESVKDFVFEKVQGEIVDASSLYSVDEQSLGGSSSLSASPRPAPLRLSTSPPRCPRSPETTTSSLQESTPPASPTRAASLTKKLSKTFSLRSVGTKRLRKKTFSEDAAATPESPPEAVRGSPKSPKSPRFSPRLTGLTTGLTALSLIGKGRGSPTTQPAEMDFVPITTLIPEDSLWDDFGDLSFSKRGSIMFGGRNDPFSLAAAGPPAGAGDELAASAAGAGAGECPTGVMLGGDATSDKARVSTMNEDSPSIPSIRVMSMDLERESQKVRSLYESGDGLNWQEGGLVSLNERLKPTEEVPSDEEESAVFSPRSKPPLNDRASTPTLAITTPPSASSSSQRGSQVRKDYERAGGLEDWEDVEGADVDRYGFINQRTPGSGSETPELRSSQLSPRRRNVLTKRPGSAYSASPLGSHLRPPDRKVSTRSLNTFASEYSTTSRRSARSSIRSATNHLPHNRDRRWMDEAGDMLALQPGLADIEEDKKTGKAAEAQKRKELERTEKWRKMAKVVNKGQVGQGMEFEFDTKNPKLIERTWKGIPDCWRAAAWHSFLSASAKSHKSTETDEHLMAEFRRLQELASTDDVQIDLDVPRTINRHIMFRKRYRGGQRLLFRVLHAISLYFPGTGYVQGMASLAATLLCYYDEERCFVMMVRLWRYRGLEILYQPGFGGLMGALEDLEKRWLAGNVADKLTELAIDSTAYGTRWYLTLFNLSIPFPAQLRVWDVFMLLGDCSPEPVGPSPEATSQTKEGTGSVAPRGLDILHATSAALIQALSEVLLDSDFENAMKALTSWVPIKDEELLMKVTRAEWRQHQSKKREKA